MSKRRFQRRSARIPHGTLTDPGEAEAILNDVDTEVAALLRDDPALGVDVSKWGQWPIALFEPRKGVGMTLPDGSLQEMQAETIIQAGFSRWRQVTTFTLLPGWSIRQTPTGLELWDKGGIWARGHLPVLPARWRTTAQEVGAVIAVYGHRVGVRPPETGSWEPTVRAAELHRSRHQGMVAVGLVEWKGLEIPEEVTYQGPSYDPDTGQFSIGQGTGAENVHWQLHTLGEGVRHGLVIGDRETGKTNLVRIVTVEAIRSGRFGVWLADPQGRHNLVQTLGELAWKTAQSPGETVQLLRAAVQEIEARHQSGGYTDPAPARPGLLLVIDEGQAVFAANPEATALAEHIVTRGGPTGVGLIVTSRGVDLAYFGGSATLRAGLATHNRMAVGSGTVTLDLLNQLPRQQGSHA